MNIINNFFSIETVVVVQVLSLNLSLSFVFVNFIEVIYSECEFIVQFDNIQMVEHALHDDFNLEVESVVVVLKHVLSIDMWNKMKRTKTMNR